MTREEAIDTLKNGLWWDRKQAEELAKKMRKQRCHHCKDGRSFDGQFIFCGNKGLFSLHFCPGCGAPLTENGEEILVGRLNETLKDE